MATPYQRPPSALNVPGLGFGTPFTSLGDQRRKVGGNKVSTHPLRVAQRKAEWEVENRDMMKEDRIAEKDYRKSAQDLARAQLAATYYRMGLNPDGTPLLPGGLNPTMGAPPSGGLTPTMGAGPLAGLTVPPTAWASPAPLSYESGGAPPAGGGGFAGSLQPDGTISFAPPAPAMTFPQLANVTPATPPAAPVGNPYLGLRNVGGTNVPSNILNLTGPARADAQQADMGLRESALAAQNLASARAAVAALQGQQAQQNVDPWTRMQNGNNAFSTLPSGATVMRTPDGNATLGSQYGTGSGTYGTPPPKSFTTIGADGKPIVANSFDQWKQNEIGERALGRVGGDADQAKAGALAGAAQGRKSFLDQLELIHQNSLKTKV